MLNLLNTISMLSTHDGGRFPAIIATVAEASAAWTALLTAYLQTLVVVTDALPLATTSKNALTPVMQRMPNVSWQW